MTFSPRAIEAALDAFNGCKSSNDIDAMQAALTAALAVDGVALQAWQPIESAPKDWIIGYTSWGQHVGKFHEHVGPCEYVDDHHEFVNIDFDVFPSPTHWMPLPPPPAASEVEERK